MTLPDSVDATLRRRQHSLLWVTLLIITIYGAIIGTLNLTVFDESLIALFNYSTATLAAGTLWLLRRTGRLQLASWLAVGILIAMLSGFMALSRGANYSLLWVTILPPIAFFLLGSRAGAWVTALFFAAVLLYIGRYFPEFQATPFTRATLFNFVEVMTGLWLLYRFSEKSREEAYAHLRHISQTDSLTGLWNRTRLDEELLQALTLAGRSGLPTALLMLDLDHFKPVNDNHGHLVGDAVLVQVAELLRKTVRASDRLGRWGGEEFVVLCPNTDRKGALQVAEKIRRSIQAAEFAEGLHLTASIGVAATRGPASPTELMETADQRMYRAKQEGRDRVCG